MGHRGRLRLYAIIATTIPVVFAALVSSASTPIIFLSLAIAIGTAFLLAESFDNADNKESGSPISDIEPVSPLPLQRWGDPDRVADRLVPAIEEALSSRLHDEKLDLPELRTALYGCIHNTLYGINQDTSDGESREVTVILSDLRGFSVITETYAAREVVDLLNRYFARMCQIIYKYGGTVDKFMGDGIMALFGAPVARKDDIHRAVCCAIEMQIAMDSFNRDNENLGMPNLFMGIGINTGFVVAAKIGSDLHSEYTVIGDEVNLASRIEAYTLRGQILISKNTYDKLHDSISAREPIRVAVKGKRDPVPLYELIAIHFPRELRVPEREVRRSLRVDVNLPFEFQLCEGKVICSELHEGRILNISSGGLFACSLAPVEPFFNVRFQLKVSHLGLVTNPIYGKVLRVKKDDDLYEMNIEFTIIEPSDRHAIKDLVNRVVEGNFSHA